MYHVLLLTVPTGRIVMSQMTKNDQEGSWTTFSRLSKDSFHISIESSALNELIISYNSQPPYEANSIINIV